MFQFKLGLLFVIEVFIVMWLSGCVVEPVRVTEVPSRPAGLQIDPNDPEKGWVTAGGQTIHYRLNSRGVWVPDTQPAPANVVTNTPDEYVPMMNFLRTYKLRAEDMSVIMSVYQQMALRDERIKNSEDLLKAVNGNLQGAVPMDQAVERARQLRQVNSLLE